MGDSDRPFAFGRIPSQQVDINESDETRNLFRQYWAAATVTFILLSFAYVATNLMFGYEDWYEVVTLIEIGLSFALFVLLRRVMFSRFDGAYLLGDENGAYLNTNTIISLFVSVVVFLYIRDRATDFIVSVCRFPEGAPFMEAVGHVARSMAIFAFLSIIAPTVSLFTRLVVREMPDQYHASIEVKTNRDKLALDWARFEEEKKRHWQNAATAEPPIPQAPMLQAPMYTPDIRRTNPNQALLPASEDERWDIACDEFLRGLEAGDFTQDERSWKGVRLVESGYNLTAIGDKIRNQLISDGWAVWNHPTKKSQGWSFTAPIEEIRKNWRIKRDPKRLKGGD